MRSLEPIAPRGTPLARRNPLALIGAALVLMAALFVAVDAVTPGLVLVVVVVAAPLGGIQPLRLLTRAWPLLLAGAAIAILNTVFAPAQHGAPLEVGPLRLGSATALTGAALGLRIIAIALSGVVALAAVDPTDLADALVQQLHASPRFALGALAAVRMLPVLGDEWRLIGLARRARGVDAGRNPLAWARLAAGRLFAMLVGAIRRGVRLSLAMDARSFGDRPCRTVARPQRMSRADWVLIGASVIVALSATGISVAVGSYRLLFG